MRFFKVNNNCIGCMACVDNCPGRALKAEWEGDKAFIYHNMAKCARCGLCWRICPENAIEFGELLQGHWDEVERFDIVTCGRCSKTICTVKQLEEIRNRVELDSELLCDECRPLAVSEKLRKSWSEMEKAISFQGAGK